MLKDVLFGTQEKLDAQRDTEMEMLLSNAPWLVQAILTIFPFPSLDSITTVSYRLLVVRFCTVHFDRLLQMCVCMHVVIVYSLTKFSKLMPGLLFFPPYYCFYLFLQKSLKWSYSCPSLFAAVISFLSLFFFSPLSPNWSVTVKPKFKNVAGIPGPSLVEVTLSVPGGRSQLLCLSTCKVQHSISGSPRGSTGRAESRLLGWKMLDRKLAVAHRGRGKMHYLGV